jgi:ComF family protein
MRKLQRLIRDITTLISPHCPWCHQGVNTLHRRCPACIKSLPYCHHFCRRCGTPCANMQDHCGQCLKKQFAFDYCIPCFHYQTPIKQDLQALKFQQRYDYAKLLGQCMSTHIKNHPLYQQHGKPELLIPIPLHYWRYVKRGYNQAHLLAKILAKQGHIPVDTRSLKRIRHTRAQSSLQGIQREKNLRDAFCLRKKIKAKHIALVDDIVTTGSTAHYAALAIKQNSSVETITLYCCARR